MSLYDAVRYNRAAEVARLLQDDGVDVNLPLYGETPFMLACSLGASSIVRLFLDSKRVTNYNHRDSQGRTPLHHASYCGDRYTLASLLADPRIDVAAITKMGKNCLDMTYRETWRIKNHIVTVTVFLASGRPEITALLNAEYCALRNKAVMLDDTRMVELIDEFRNDPGATRGRLRCDLGYPEYAAAQLFATIVLLCDDYYEIKE